MKSPTIDIYRRHNQQVARIHRYVDDILTDIRLRRLSVWLTGVDAPRLGVNPSVNGGIK